MSAARKNTCTTTQLITFMPDLASDGSTLRQAYVLSKSEFSNFECRAATVNDDETSFNIGSWVFYDNITSFAVNLTGTNGITPGVHVRARFVCTTPGENEAVYSQGRESGLRYA